MPFSALLRRPQLSRVHDSTCSTGIDTERVVDVLHDADRAQRLDPAIRAEVARWTHRPGDANDGLRDDDRGPTPRSCFPPQPVVWG